MNIWVIRPGALGDTLLTIPLLFSIKADNPDACVTLVGPRAYKELIPKEFGFNAIDHPDSIWMFQSEHSRKKLNVKPCDSAYVILKDPKNVISKLRSQGVDTILSASPTPRPGSHLVETLHTQLGLAIPPRCPVLKNLRAPKPQNLAWIHPGSGGQIKLAPLKLFREVSRALQKTTGCDIVITLGEADMNIKFLEDWGPWLKESHAKVMERRSLLELCGCVSNARFFVGNDSGISHLAAYLGIFTILFFISTDPIQWAPWAPPEQSLILDYRFHDLSVGLQAQAEEAVNKALILTL